MSLSIEKDVNERLLSDQEKVVSIEVCIFSFIIRYNMLMFVMIAHKPYNIAKYVELNNKLISIFLENLIMPWNRKF